MKFSKLAEKITAFMERFTVKQMVIMAAAAGIAVFFILYVFLSAVLPKEQNASVQGNMVSVVVAKENIAQRAVVQESMLKVVSMPADVVPDGAVTDIAAAVGHPASVPIFQGDVLTDKKLFLDEKMAGFVGSIPPDCRAISVAISDITGIAGFARPGDYVDVMLISDKKDKTRFSGEILFQNVLLLGMNKNSDANSASEAKDDKSGKDGKDNKDKQTASSAKENAATATLALRPEEALRLAVAAQEGTIYLVLRPFKPQNMFVADTDYYDAKPVELPTAPQQPAASTPAPVYSPQPAAPVPSQPASKDAVGSENSIEVIRGTAVSTVEVR